MNIKCSNQTCGSIIPVPDGTQYVVCPSCSTYHFVSDFENQARQEPPNQGGYGIPEPFSSGSGYAPPPFEANPAYQPTGDVFQSETPSFMAQPKPVQQEATSIGILVTEDGRQLQLKVGKNTIGRKEGDLNINDITISRRHCIIEVTPKIAGGGWNYSISDIGIETGIGSTNGVFISHRSVRLENNERVPIMHGMVLQLGSVRLMLHAP